VPKACRKIDNTMIIRVNAVIPRTNEGRTVRIVMSNRIWSDNEYVVPPPSISDAVIAGKPSALRV